MSHLDDLLNHPLRLWMDGVLIPIRVVLPCCSDVDDDDDARHCASTLYLLNDDCDT